MGKTYIFGYGSLIASCGVNHRGLKRIYTEADIIETHIRDHKREMNAVAYENDFLAARFFGLSPHADTRTNGVLFEISDEDWIPFVRSEGGGRIYSFELVTQFIEYPLQPDDIVVTCIVMNPSRGGWVRREYIKRCRNALRFRSPDFQKEFGNVKSYK